MLLPPFEWSFEDIGHELAVVDEANLCLLERRLLVLLYWHAQQVLDLGAADRSNQAHEVSLGLKRVNAELVA